MLDRLRSRLESSLSSVGRSFSKLETSPTAWTFVGLLVSVLAAWSYTTGRYTGEFLAGVLVLVSGWFDLVDGAVARVTGRTSKRGAFLDSTMDRVAEVALFTGVLLGGYSQPFPIVLAISLSLLVSYTRARGESLGVKLAGVGIGERSERLLIVAVSSLLGLVAWGVLLVVVVAGFTFIERTYTASKALGGAQEPKDISTQPDAPTP